MSPRWPPAGIRAGSMPPAFPRAASTVLSSVLALLLVTAIARQGTAPGVPEAAESDTAAGTEAEDATPVQEVLQLVPPPPPPETAPAGPPPVPKAPVAASRREVPPPAVPVAASPGGSILDGAALPAEQGRALLRLLEAGGGPAISIAWPEDPAVRAELGRRLRACHGMTYALLGEDGTLSLPEGPVDPDRFSLLMRVPSGPADTAEEAAGRALARRHPGARGMLVRLLPRRVDAAVLGGLHVLLGDSYYRAGQISAAYHLTHGQVLVGAVRSDGRAVPGQIRLPRATPSCG